MFEGFAPPTRNYFAMPNEWTDITAEIDSLAELKVIEYVLRHTWGFHEFGITKAISVDEFMHGRKRGDGSRMDKGTGLKSDRSVKDGIKLAVQHGYLICHVDGSDQARIRKSYALKMNSNNNLPARGVVTTSQVDTTRGRNHPSDPHLLPLNQVVSTPRSEKETREKHFRKKESEKPLVNLELPTPQPNSLSFSQEKSSSLLDQLTDEQSNCWTRCQALTGAQNLTQKAYEGVVTLAGKVTTTADLQSLYDYACERGEKIAKAQGRKADQPNVGTMVHFLPEWEQAQARKQQEKEQAAHEHIPGTGKLTNWTAARMAGTLPPVNYDPLPTVKPASGLSQIGNISAGLQERIRQARERRAAQEERINS